MSIDITAGMVETFRHAISEHHGTIPTDYAHDALTALLADEEIRQAVHTGVRRELDAKLWALGVTGYSFEGI